MTKTTLSIDSRLLMERFGWTNCGGEYWEHGDYPMQQIHECEAIRLTREMHDRELRKI